MNKSEQITKTRKLKKRRLIEALGNRCQMCGYDKCDSALEFHHLDSTKKDSDFNNMFSHNWNWKRCVLEVSKCILLCANCHREHHNENVPLPGSFQVFDEALITSKEEPKIIVKKSRPSKIDWLNLDWDYLNTTYKTNVAIAEVLGVSDSIVSRKRRQINS